MLVWAAASPFQLFHTVSGRHEAQMLWGSQQTMEGVQKYEGGGCEGGGGGGWGCGGPQWACCSRHRQKHYTDTAWIQALPPVLPPKNEKKTTPKQSYKKTKQTKKQGSVDGRRMHGVMLPMGHCMYFDHARLMVALVARYRGWWDANMSIGHAINVGMSMSEAGPHCRLAFWVKHHLLPPNPGPTWGNLPLMGTF